MSTCITVFYFLSHYKFQSRTHQSRNAGKYETKTTYKVEAMTKFGPIAGCRQFFLLQLIIYQDARKVFNAQHFSERAWAENVIFCDLRVSHLSVVKPKPK